MILAGKTAVVTGGALRIGREIGRVLAEQGVHVCVHYHNSVAAAQAAVEEFKSLGVRATSIRADLQTPLEAARGIMHHAASTLGPVQILINSASIFDSGSLLSTDESHWDRELTVNLKAPFFLSQEFVRLLPGEMSGAIVNLVDWRGERTPPGHAAYTISKAGLIAQTRLLAQELGPQVRVNAVAPGAILPPHGESPAEYQQRSTNNPLKTTGSPAEIARAVIYLLTAPFVTGDILHVTGGVEL